MPQVISTKRTSKKLFVNKGTENEKSSNNLPNLTNSKTSQPLHYELEQIPAKHQSIQTSSTLLSKEQVQLIVSSLKTKLANYNISYKINTSLRSLTPEQRTALEIVESFIKTLPQNIDIESLVSDIIPLFKKLPNNNDLKQYKILLANVSEYKFMNKTKVMFILEGVLTNNQDQYSGRYRFRLCDFNSKGNINTQKFFKYADINTLRFFSDIGNSISHKDVDLELLESMPKQKQALCIAIISRREYDLAKLNQMSINDILKIEFKDTYYQNINLSSINDNDLLDIVLRMVSQNIDKSNIKYIINNVQNIKKITGVNDALAIENLAMNISTDKIDILLQNFTEFKFMANAKNLNGVIDFIKDLSQDDMNKLINTYQLMAKSNLLNKFKLILPILPAFIKESSRNYSVRDQNLKLLLQNLPSGTKIDESSSKLFMQYLGLYSKSQENVKTGHYDDNLQTFYPFKDNWIADNIAKYWLPLTINKEKDFKSIIKYAFDSIKSIDEYYSMRNNGFDGELVDTIMNEVSKLGIEILKPLSHYRIFSDAQLKNLLGLAKNVIYSETAYIFKNIVDYTIKRSLEKGDAGESKSSIYSLDGVLFTKEMLARYIKFDFTPEHYKHVIILRAGMQKVKISKDYEVNNSGKEELLDLLEEYQKINKIKISGLSEKDLDSLLSKLIKDNQLDIIRPKRDLALDYPRKH